MIITIIVAVSENGVIGNNNTLPWKLREDLYRFKDLTTGHCIIMGRKNYDDIGRPLPNRTNIIITRQTNFKANGCHVVSSLDDALALAKSLDESNVFIIGGAQIYEMFMGIADQLLITEVHSTYEGDVFFPKIDERWVEISRVGPFKKDEYNECDFSFITYVLR